MNVLVFGEKSDFKRFEYKFPGHSVKNISAGDEIPAESFDIIFWFNHEEDPEILSDLLEFEVPLFINISTTTLTELFSLQGITDGVAAGFCGIPGLFERDILEVSLRREADRKKIEETLHLLKTDFEIVEDRVGMVTPRTLFMIINEAYFTWMEGVASREDIDLAMKTGTNYPMGPFEWVKKIGIEHVYETLDAIYFQTSDPRYRMCEALKKEYLNSTNL